MTTDELRELVVKAMIKEYGSTLRDYGTADRMADAVIKTLLKKKLLVRE